MNILVIGAAGKTGKLVVEQALAADHAVTALVRNESAYSSPAGVRVVAGDASDSATLMRAMASQDAVIDAIGGKTPYLKTDLETRVARAVVSTMKQAGVRKLIALSAIGVGDSAKQGNFLFRYLFLPTFLRGSTQDKAAMEQIIRDSNLDFVIVRPAVLNDQPATGAVRVFTQNEKAHKVTRADVAQFSVDLLANSKHLGQSVTIANS